MTHRTTLGLKISKIQSIRCHPDKRCQEVVQVYSHRIGHQLVVAQYFIPQMLPSNQKDNHPFGTPR